MTSIPAVLFERARSHPTSAAYFAKRGGAYRCTDYQGYAAEVMLAARALIACGFAPGDTLCLLGFNRPEWLILDLAAMTLGGSAAGIYTTSSSEECLHILAHARASVLWVENLEQENKIAPLRDQLPKLRTLISSNTAAHAENAAVISWTSFLAKAESVPESEVLARMHALREQDIATLIYTSGTTGPPKAVALTHANLVWTANLLDTAIHSSASDVTLSYLPLSHIAEQMASIHGPITAGSAVYFAESLEALPVNLKEARPTIFFAVPRVWEKFHAALSSKMKLASGNKARLLSWSQNVSTRAHQFLAEGRTVPLFLQLQLAFARKLVLDKVKAAIGLDRAKILVSGAAPIGEQVLQFFVSLDLPICEIYGQSEGSGPTSLNLPSATRIGSVGRPLPGVEVRIADDGEILVKGQNIFAGYLHDEAATRDALDQDGTLHSGDLGTIDRDGYLHITGRKKDILITAGGKNITPKNIELAIGAHPAVNECVVVGDRRKYLVLLVTLNPDDERCQRAHHDAHAMSEVRQLLQVHIDSVNQTLARVEQIKAFRILPRAFSQDAGELTPTMKIRRAAVTQNHIDAIESMYVKDTP